MVQLNFAIAGDGRPFTLEVDVDIATVLSLKKQIKDENPSTIYCDPEHLDLYVAQCDGQWISDEDPVLQTLPMEVECPVPWSIFLKDENKLDFIEQIPGFSEDQDFPRIEDGEIIHVLVVLPCIMVAPEIPVNVQLKQVTVNGICLTIQRSMAVNPFKLRAFYDFCRNTQLDPTVGGVIKLPNDMLFLDAPCFPTCFYIRQCYTRLLRHCLEAIQSQHVVLLGNYGIGKTYFGYFLLFYLIHHGKTVVYEQYNTRPVYLLSQEFVMRGAKGDFDRVLKSDETYYICDGQEPLVVQAKTFLVTSSPHSISYSFFKSSSRLYFLPVWTKVEMLHCREVMLGHISENEVKNRFHKWGGIAGYVFKNSEKLGDLNQVLSTLTTRRLVDSIRSLDRFDRYISHLLLHYCVSDDFERIHFDFASSYIKNAMYKRFTEVSEQKEELLKIIACLDGTASSVLRGHFFEMYVHSILPRGGHFRARRLPFINFTTLNVKIQDGTVKGHICNIDYDSDQEDFDLLCHDDEDDMGKASEIEDDHDRGISDKAVIEVHSFDPLERTTFKCASDLENASRGYLLPAMKNFPSIDAIIKPDILIQIAGAHKPLCTQSGIDNVLKLLGNPRDPKLYFVVPPNQFASFQHQPFVDSKGNAVEITRFKNSRKIQQYALELRLDDVSA